MNQGKKSKWRPPKNVNGIMFFGHNNITRTNLFSMGDYVLKEGHKPSSSSCHHMQKIKK
jgi:hypothetical protein